VVTPQVLRSKIEKILQKDLILTSEKGSAKNEKSAIESQLIELKQQNEVHVKQTDDLKRSLKHHQTILHRVQKKLQLVARERDFFKQLLDSYEKDLTSKCINLKFRKLTF
jgi:mitotic spindle assembly checkpoint protein MAD1